MFIVCQASNTGLVSAARTYIIRCYLENNIMENRTSAYPTDMDTSAMDNIKNSEFEE
jgi:hypothetical protein